MIKQFNNTEKYKKDTTKFGGLIFESDFDTNARKSMKGGSLFASRIISDHAFDIWCAKKQAKRNTY